MPAGPVARPGSSDEVRAGRVRWPAEARVLVGVLLAGVLVAVVWRLLDPHTVHLGDDNETNAAVDSTLALVGGVAGLGTAVFVLLWPGSAPAVRAAVVILGSVVGAVISWQVGDLLGTPALVAHGAAVIWPLATAVFLFLGALLPGTSRRLEPPDAFLAFAAAWAAAPPIPLADPVDPPAPPA